MTHDHGFSLTGFLSLPESRDIRQKIRSHLTLPTLPHPREILYPNIIQGAGEGGILGPAFDYLTRFHLLKWHPEHHTQRKWLATLAVNELDGTDQHEVVKRLHDEGLECIDRYLQGRLPAEGLVTTAVLFAQLEVYYRTGRFEDQLQVLPPRVLQDLHQLLAALRKECFPVKHRMVLNPVFASGPLGLRGADGDVILDDCLLEIKATNRPGSQHWVQLIAYVLLDDLGLVHRYGMDQIGVYYPRFGGVLQVSLRGCLKDRAGLAEFFQDRLLHPEKYLSEESDDVEADSGPPELRPQLQVRLEHSLQTITTYQWFLQRVGKKITFERIRHILLDHLPEYGQLGDRFDTHVYRILRELQGL